MRWDVFKDPNRQFSVVLFIRSEDLELERKDLEELGSRPNVRLVVQPSPFEAIEFLYRVAHQIFGHKVSMDKDLFWHALVFKKDADAEKLEQVSAHHYQYLCGILEQDPKKVEREGKVLQSLADALK
ncbi:MAG: hypothetical protein V1798_07645 [Pseudomonadota bacterium]